MPAATRSSTAADATSSRTIDLNADLGEGYGSWSMGDDESMLRTVTTANIACGGHAGDPSTMRAALRSAQEQHVAITAHVAYPDLLGFGRRFMDIPAAELTDQVIFQAGALIAMAGAEGATVRGVKPHGALYNAVANHELQAAAVVTALEELSPVTGEPLALVAAPGSLISRLARDAGIPIVLEGFADRAYTREGTLVPRTTPGAVHTDPAAVLEQALRLAEERQVRTIDGSVIDLPCDSVCLHGDTPGAVSLAQQVRERLASAGITLRAAL